MKGIARELPVTIVNSINPYRLEGQKTAAFEVCDQLGGMAPDYHFLPVGNAGNITAYWMGYKEYHKHGRIKSLPRMIGIQAAGAAPIVRGHVIENPQTIASAIRIGNPASWKGALTAAEESGGQIDMVTDDEIIQAYHMLASLEGVFCEAASAASVAGVIKKNREGLFKKGDRIVCTLTGHGLKDTEMAINLSRRPVTVKASKEEVMKILGF